MNEGGGSDDSDEYCVSEVCCEEKDGKQWFVTINFLVQGPLQVLTTFILFPEHPCIFVAI